MGITRGPKIIRDGLVLNVDIAATTGSNWYDISSNKYTGSFDNGASVSRVARGSINITSGSSQRVTIPNNSNFQFDSGSEFSAFCWIKFKGTQDGTTGFFGNAEFQGGGWMLATDGNIPRIVVNDNIVQSTLNSSTTLQNNRWYNIGFTYSNLSASLYINGELDVSGGGMELSTNTSDLWIGDGQQGGWENTFHGYINQCTIYNRLLTDTEIRENYISVKNRYLRPKYYTSDSIMDLDPLVYLTPDSIDSEVSADGNDITIWEDVSKYNADFFAAGDIPKLNITSGGIREVEFKPDPDNDFLRNTGLELPVYDPQNDSFTLIIQEGDIMCKDGQLFQHRASTSGTSLISWHVDLAGDDFNISFYGGSAVNGSVPVVSNRLSFLIFDAGTIELWVDGSLKRDSGWIFGTDTTDYSNVPWTIGANNNAGISLPEGTIRRIAMIGRAITTMERQAIEAEFQIN